MSYEPVYRYPIPLEIGKKYQLEVQGNEVVISKMVEKPDWRDVTDKCYLSFIASKHSTGMYVVVMLRHNGKPDERAAVIGFRGAVAQHGFKVDQPKGASVSFSIWKKIGR